MRRTSLLRYSSSRDAIAEAYALCSSGNMISFRYSVHRFELLVARTEKEPMSAKLKVAELREALEALDALTPHILAHLCDDVARAPEIVE